ncbi:hypothetical protein DPMN_050494 [Dreissena polymorpha]|uniref:Uncharacterized protein n=1 Tax=Dreissena polymorpha TaxID=45954 RepID=A0A9D4CI50_DREPO|nr:hypothetical protein DPMN_050494 [Dreissena polymorpha]
MYIKHYINNSPNDDKYSTDVKYNSTDDDSNSTSNAYDSHKNLFNTSNYDNN